MAIAPMFTSEDVMRPALREPFRHGDHLFATDGRIALVCRSGTSDGIKETDDVQQKSIGERIINEHVKACEVCIERCQYQKYELGKISDAVCAAFANVEPEMMWLRMNEPDEDDPDDDFEPDSVRHIHEVFTAVIMADPARSVVAGYYASLIMGLENNFGPVEAFANTDNPEAELFFRGPDWKCVLMPRRAKSGGVNHEWNYYGGCAIADAQTGKLVWGRDLSGVVPDLETLRKGVEK